MEIALEILKYVLPSIIVFVGVYFIMQNFLEKEQKKLDMRYKTDNLKLVTPVKLQAFERIILYLERISLSNLVMRIYKPGMSAKDLQASMLNAIRTEYEHNMAQQLYVSSRSWKMVKSAKDETVKVINSCAEQLSDKASGLELSQFIIELVSQTERTPTDVAIEAVKKEINRAF